MSDETSVHKLWITQAEDPFSMSLDDVRARASKLRTTITRRNMIEYVVGAFLIMAFGGSAFVAPTLLGKLGCALTALGVALVCWRMYVLTSPRTMDPSIMAQAWVRHYRAEMERQRDALAKIWVWYLGPLVPGMVVYWVAAGAKSIADGSWVAGGAVTLGGLALCAVVFSWVANANHRAAQQLQAEIDLLDEASDGEGGV